MPAVDLHGLPGHPLGGPAHVGLDHRGLQRALALGHQPGHLVRVLPRGLDDDRHAGQLDPGQLVVDDGRAEDHAARRRRPGPPRRPPASPRGPGPPSAAARSRTPASGGRSPGPGPPGPPTRLSAGHEPVVEGQLVGVHAPVADGVDGPTLQAPGRSAGPRPPGPGGRRTPRRRPAACRPRTATGPRWPRARSGSVRASSISTSARAAKVHQVLAPLISQPPVDRGGRR